MDAIEYTSPSTAENQKVSEKVNAKAPTSPEKRIEISSVTGVTPINVYVSDSYGNFETLILTIPVGESVPPATGVTLSSVFNSVPAILLKMVDANNCSKMQYIECRFGCSFLITLELASCSTDITITT